MQARERCHDSSTIVVLFQQEKMIKNGQVSLVTMYHPLDDSKSSSSNQALIRYRRRREKIAKVRRPRRRLQAGSVREDKTTDRQAKKLSQVRRESEQSKSNQMGCGQYCDAARCLLSAAQLKASFVADRTAMLGSTLYVQYSKKKKVPAYKTRQTDVPDA